jgi:acyl-coenzyme A synthetase/AMP-(fatty) acid ligase
MTLSSFPYRPEESKDSPVELFVRTSAIAWIVWLSYRLLESQAFGASILGCQIRNSIPIKGSVLFFITVLATYFTNSSKTRVYRQSIT